MKWKKQERTDSNDIATSKLRKSPFLVLPKIEVEMPAKNPGLRLFTKTWQPHHNNHQRDTETSRPLTATLEKPQILDINLVTKIDMSLIRKEFLCIANLCRVPLRTLTPLPHRARHNKLATGASNNISTINAGRGDQSRRCRRPSNRPLSLPVNKVQLKKSSRPCTSEDSWEEDRSSSSQTCSSLSSKKSSIMNKTKSPKTIPTMSPIKQTKIAENDANNNNHINRLNSTSNGYKTYRIPNKRTARVSVIDKTSATSLSKLPQPCKTCGRVDQPERFHSHPETPPLAPKKMNEKTTVVKNTVQKPVAIKYKSKLTEKKKISTAPVKKDVDTTVRSPRPPQKDDGSAAKTNNGVAVRNVASSKGPRTLTCYICGREFGTMSLPLHEPKCMEKWDRENASLPPHLRRKRPSKPDHALTKDEWNVYAWESSQATLVPCQNCGRTFYPDRLVVHQRSCKRKESKEPKGQPAVVMVR
ncbi:putative cactus-binding C-terminus of cactin protein [Trypoxylus dichotomus]